MIYTTAQKLKMSVPTPYFMMFETQDVESFVVSAQVFASKNHERFYMCDVDPDSNSILISSSLFFFQGSGPVAPLTYKSIIRSDPYPVPWLQNIWN